MKNFLKLFLGISAVYLGLLLFNLEQYALFFKPLLLLNLIMAVYKASSFKTRSILLIALFFSWIGDILLMFVEHGELFFICGLVSFLISHVFYIVLFVKQVALKPLSKPLLGLGILFTAVYLVSFLSVIIPHLGDLKIPVIVYAFVLCTMLVAAIRGALIWNSNASRMILIGAIAFISSDSLLAFNKFYAEYAFAGFLIMITYLIAQYCISVGILDLNKVS